ncbi:MAG: hypothetical protein CSB48_01680 [Proteobacteria bacterium]|nr:MAG: hypothetical protein CSB48_01680 [Pseudomonadota bacterium]PIE40234.1 MAG: hypothetical protein CSA51_01775 [Gammaproteobacteria bacterium]
MSAAVPDKERIHFLPVGKGSVEHISQSPPMTSPVTATTDWIYCLNKFRFFPLGKQNRFVPDRDFTLKSYIDAIQNNIKTCSDTALSISMPLKHTLCEHYGVTKNTHPIRNYLDNLLQEARLISELVPRRCTISYLHWNKNIHQLLDDAEMTELMFHLNKHFSLLPEGKGRYVIELRFEHITDNTIPLIKGLGFTHICLETPTFTTEPQARQFVRQMAMMRNYGFETISASLALDDDIDIADKKRQIDVLTESRPDSICLLDSIDRYRDTTAKDQSASSPDSDLIRQLISAGYTKKGFCKYSNCDKTDKWYIHDLIAMGLSANSIIDNILTRNADQLDQYIKCIREKQLPFQYGGYLIPQNG